MQPQRTFHLPPAESTIAPAYDNLFQFILWLSVFFFVVITVGTIAFAWMYRKKKGEPYRLTPGFCHNTALELIWSIIPTVLFFVIFVWGFHLYMQFYVTPGKAEEIQVNAWQWGWGFTYPQGAKSDILVVPEGRPIKLLMSSQDVIHSLFIPDFRVKMDVLPNRYSSLWFTANRADEFDLYCAEYCGQKHSRMTTRVRVLPEDRYRQWLEENSGTPTGDVLYKRYACHTCHSLDGATGNGPTFQSLFGKTESMTDGSSIVVDENYLRESILEPKAKIVKGFDPVMPTFQATLNQDELNSIIEFIKTVK